MTRSCFLLILILAAATLVCAAPSRAGAQWYVGVSLGTNHTQPAVVEVEAPSQGVSLRFHDVHFEARPFTSPQYYGWRAGRMFGASRRVGLELEFIHLKVISDTSQTYVTTPGTVGGGVVATLQQMNTTVQRYQMTHGLNFAFANIVLRAPLRIGKEGPLSLALRAGAGPAIPHAESTVLGETREQYQYAGMGAHGSLALELRANARVSVSAEYKLTFAQPEITLAHGTGRTTTLTQHVTGGLIVRLTK